VHQSKPHKLSTNCKGSNALMFFTFQSQTVASFFSFSHPTSLVLQDLFFPGALLSLDWLHPLYLADKANTFNPVQVFNES
jgi:hypothetical protein